MTHPDRRKKTYFRIGEQCGYFFESVRFGEDLRNFRLLKGLTQDQVGEIFGTSGQMVGLLEKGDVVGSTFLIFMAKWADLNIMNYIITDAEPFLPLTLPTRR